MPKVLVVEDNRTMLDALVISLSKIGLDVRSAADGTAGLEALKTEMFDILVSDYRLPSMDGLDLLQKARELCPGIDVILITAYGSVNLAVEAMKLGAADFLTKPFSAEELRVKVEKVLESKRNASERARLAEENAMLWGEVAEAGGFGEIIGESESIKAVFQKIALVAESDASVLISGESGTGKELVARAIHSRSPRAGKPFVRVCCAALAEGVLESELFGHEKGAFTGSVKSRKGRFELADGGTVFLDEVGDIPPATQVKLLRVLQEREFERVGGEKTISVDVRIISATNKNLLEEVRSGKFREDLFYRLHVVPIELPPLRERPGDIPHLARYLTAKICRKMNRPVREIDDEVFRIFSSYNWPGNVREMENVIERAIVLSRGDSLEAGDLPSLAESQLAVCLPENKEINLNETLDTLERRIIQQALARCSGNKTKTASMLGIKTSALYYKLEKYGLL